MQTWLPYASYKESADVLARLQLTESLSTAWTLIHTFHETMPASVQAIRPDSPIYRMWSGYEPHLCEYALTIAERSDRNSEIVRALQWHLELSVSGDADILPPVWLGEAGFHYSHQSALIRKDPGHYRPLFGSAVPDDIPLIWPVS